MPRAVAPEPSEASIPIGGLQSRMNEESLRLLFENLEGYAIFMLSPDGMVLSWNAGAERIKGYTADEIIGRNFSIFYAPEDIAGGTPDRELEVAARDGRLETEGWRLRKDGSRFWANAVITALKDDRGDLVGFGKITRDLTQSKRDEEARKTFISNAAHELRTPLSVLIGMISFLRTLPKDAAADVLAEHIETLDRQGERMRVLVNNLLDLTKLEQQPLSARLEPVSLDDTLERLLAALPPPGGKRVVRDLGDLSVLAEPRSLEQVFANLLGNAYRYGGDEIAIRASSQGEEVLIEFVDDGPGVDDSIRGVMFEPFRRGQSNPGVEGSGLGLTIVRGLVESFRGRIELDHSARGARFVITLLKG